MSAILPYPGDIAAPASFSTPDDFLESLYESVGELQYDFRNRNLNRLVADLAAGESVLDIGCGSGGLLGELRRRGKDVFGLEPNWKLIDIAARLDPEVTIRQGSGDDVEDLNRRFDAVTMVDVLEHIEDDLAQLGRLHRCLNRQGRLILVVPAHQWLYGERDRLNGHFRRYSRKQLVDSLQSTGYQVESIRSWNLAGVAPYWISERVLGRPLSVGLRRQEKAGRLGTLARQLIDGWLRYGERHVSVGCGLSLICVARACH